MSGARQIVFEGFPRHWIPLFEWFGIAWLNSTTPREYIPFFSDLDEKEIVKVIRRSKAASSLRILVESTSMLDPVLADFLYHVDYTAKRNSKAMEIDMQEILQPSPNTKKRPLILTGWQGYGRPSVKALESALLRVTPSQRSAVILPCSVTRPYDRSITHKRIYRVLQESGYDLKHLHRIVFTSLGVLPEEMWNMPQVLRYDARVPDIYRILRLARAYFSKISYECVLDCQNFVPYSDILRIVEREGIIKGVTRIKIPGKSHFFVRTGFVQPSLGST